jgi:hypothetical protein
LACLVTRPRHGFVGKAPAARWGDVDGRAALEVALESEPDLSSEGHIEEITVEDEEARGEWAALESKMNRRTFGI